MENNSEYYLIKLKETETPGKILAEFYCSLYNIIPTKSETMMCNRLVKAFGRFNVFYSILKMSGTYPEKVEEPSPLLYAICLGRFEKEYDDSVMQARESLLSYVNGIDRDIERVKKEKHKDAPSPEGLDKNV